MNIDALYIVAGAAYLVLFVTPTKHEHELIRVLPHACHLVIGLCYVALGIALTFGA